LRLIVTDSLIDVFRVNRNKKQNLIGKKETEKKKQILILDHEAKSQKKHAHIIYITVYHRQTS
jgi:hypothetical protein